MARPMNCRRVGYMPECNYFKPRGIPLKSLETVILNVDELEAIRLADFEGLYQEDAAKKMNISRQTFGRILESAHKKIADTLIVGKALQIEGGNIKMAAKRIFACADCEHRWEIPFGSGRPQACPECGSRNFHRLDLSRGGGRGRRGGGWRGGAGRSRRFQNT